jgi:hypothetical protein
VLGLIPNSDAVALNIVATNMNCNVADTLIRYGQDQTTGFPRFAVFGYSCTGYGVVPFEGLAYEQESCVGPYSQALSYHWDT